MYGQLKAFMQKDVNVPLTVPQMSLAGGVSQLSVTPFFSFSFLYFVLLFFCEFF